MNEKEWKKFKRLKDQCLERFCERILGEAQGISEKANKSAYEKYLDLFQLVNERDREIVDAFDGLSRSKAFMQLMLMYKLNLVDEEQLDEFEDEIKNKIREIVNRGKP